MKLRRDLEDKIRRVIKDYSLTTKSRSWTYTSKRMVIARYMTSKGFTNEEIGNYLSRDRTTVINMINRGESLELVKDSSYMMVKKAIIAELEVPILKNIEQRVLECTEFWQVLKLQTEIKKNRGVLN